MENTLSAINNSRSEIISIEYAKEHSRLFCCKIRGHFPDSSIAQDLLKNYRPLISNTALMSELDEESTVAIILAVGEFGDIDDIPILRSQVTRQTSETVIYAAIYAIRSIGGLDAMISLNEITKLEYLQTCAKDTALVSAAEVRTNDNHDASFGPWHSISIKELYYSRTGPLHDFNSGDEFKKELLSDSTNPAKLREIIAHLDAK